MVWSGLERCCDGRGLEIASSRGRRAVQTKGTRSAGRPGQRATWDSGQGEGKHVGGTHDMAAEGLVLTCTGRTATRKSFTGETGCSYTAWCHARIMQASGSHSGGTTARVKTVDHDDIQVGSWPAAASADQVQGIQRGSGSQAGERMGALQRHGCGRRRRCCEVKRPRGSGATCTGTWVKGSPRRRWSLLAGT
jgi:hypothetical protein